MPTIYFGTNRKPNDRQQPTDFGGEFSEKGLADLRFGEAEVDPDEKSVHSITAYDESPQANLLGSKTLFSSLRTRMQNEGCDTLLYIHGFNVKFRNALVTGAKLQRKYLADNGLAMNVVVLSWPSDGNVLFYRSDRHDAKASGLAVARGLIKLIRFLQQLKSQEMCRSNIHLLAHSMGNYVLRCAVQELMNFTPRHLPCVLDQILLVAADEDNDALEHDYKLARLTELAKRITVYFNPKDAPLWFARNIKGYVTRLGHDGPSHPRDLDSKFTLVDCGKVAGETAEHCYYFNCAKVIDDIKTVLQGDPSDLLANRSYIQPNNAYRLA